MLLFHFPGAINFYQKLREENERLKAELLKERRARQIAQDALVPISESYNRLREALIASEHALRSYQYGNGSRQLAQEIADMAHAALSLESRK